MGITVLLEGSDLMKRSIGDMARYIKNIIPHNIPETYTIKSMFNHITGEENIRKGVLAFRDLLYSVCDQLIADGHLYDKPDKSKQENDSHASLSVSFPFLNNMKSILFNIGYHGELIENGSAIFLEDLKLLTSVIGVDGKQMKSKISDSKLIGALKFLHGCGIYFDGIDLDAPKLNISGTLPLKITYPYNLAMLTGLKVMAIAQRDLYTKGNQDTFLRCDYRVLKDEDTDITDVLKDFIIPLPAAVQDVCLNLHQRCLDGGFKCVMDVFYLNVRLIYSYKNKEVWTLSVACDSGYRILIKAQNTQKYTDVIKTFPLYLQEKIARGYGCNKKLFKEPCQKGCHGFSFPLDDSIISISPYINVWLEHEISCLQRKK